MVTAAATGNGAPHAVPALCAQQQHRPPVAVVVCHDPRIGRAHARALNVAAWPALHPDSCRRRTNDKPRSCHAQHSAVVHRLEVQGCQSTQRHPAVNNFVGREVFVEL